MQLSPKYDRLEGDAGALDEIAARIAAKEPIWNVARYYGVTQGQLLRWLTTDPDRAVVYANALKACSHNVLVEGLQKATQADALLNRATRIAALATEDTAFRDGMEAGVCVKAASGKMGIAKFHVDVAGVLNPERYGRQAGVEGIVVGALTNVLREISERRMAERLAVSEAQAVARREQEKDVSPVATTTRIDEGVSI